MNKFNCVLAFLVISCIFSFHLLASSLNLNNEEEIMESRLLYRENLNLHEDKDEGEAYYLIDNCLIPSYKHIVCFSENYLMPFYQHILNISNLVDARLEEDKRVFDEWLQDSFDNILTGNCISCYPGTN
jgi:hypothetical protein